VADELNARPVSRAYALDDLHVRSDGSGRVVEAYAATFQHRAEIMDQDGHYHEELAPTSFTTTIATRGLNFGVLFNHGRTIDGEPNPSATMPIGVPLEVKADERGVFTATRYLDNPLADQALDGSVPQVDPDVPRRSRSGGAAAHHPPRDRNAGVRAGGVRRL
jgi:phage head maturation protease